MLTELAVSDLGVIESLRLLLGPGMTALTGETGAGKTLVIGAIDLLLGGRADPSSVRPGATEAVVEGRFVAGDDEVVLTRVVPADGRSRAYIDGRLAPASALAERGAVLVDLHGQHAHQSLLAAATQRAALDRFGAVDLANLHAARHELAVVDTELASLGGDEHHRAREIDLVRFQVGELEGAKLDDADEDDRLGAEEDLLADAVAHRAAATAALAALAGDGAALDALGNAVAAVASRSPFAGHEGRLRGLVAEVTDVSADLRAAVDGIDDDPARLTWLRERRQLLHDLRRKYGDSLLEVMAYRDEATARLAELESHDERAAELDGRRHHAGARVAEAAAEVKEARRAAAPGLAAAVARHLGDLGMPKAHIEIDVGDDGAGDAVAFLLAANPGAPLLPLSRAASGGELSRAMLALRLVLSGAGDDDGTAPPTLVFDEVDAGIGGRAASAVGRALAALGRDRQVLVVTHLPQVAAHADAQVAVTKVDDGTATRADAAVVADGDRVVELSRMLSGSPESDSARHHAAELLATAARDRRHDRSG
ncbi:MAG: DNA repair protein RecN [Acidimicrobiia bacterium]